jgi:hypothetical protein
MAGGQMRNTAFGTTSEHLAEAFLSAFAFTTRVSRENDLGHDLHCVLHEHSDALGDPDDAEEGGTARASGVLSAGPPFNVQVKSDRRAISYEKPHARKWIGTQQSPFFVCVVSRKELTFDFHSTWNLNNAIQMYGYGWDTDHVTRIDLIIPQPNDDWPGIADIKDPRRNNGVLAVPLGPAILSAKMTDVMVPDTAKKLASVLGDWIALERANIVRQATRMHWVYGPDHWHQNARLDGNTPMTGEFFYNPENLEPDPEDPHRPTVGQNMVRSVFALLYAIERHRRQQGGLPLGITPELEATLRSVLDNARHMVIADNVMQSVIEKILRRPRIPAQTTEAT